MDALIPAAGRGARLDRPDTPKPLVEVDGVPLIVRTLRQLQAAAGADAARCATSTIGWTHHPAAQPTGPANPGETSEISPAASPRIVTGPTNGPANRFAASPTTLTCPDSAVTMGWVANCAANGTATDSASQPGAQPRIAVCQRPAHHKIPAVAVTDNANPHDRESQGSISTSTSTARLSARSPRARSWASPVAAIAMSPMAAALNTLGSARQTTMNAAATSTAIPRSHQPRTPAWRASPRVNTSISVRLVPLTAVR